MERKHMRFLSLLVSLLVLVSLCATTVFAADADTQDPVCYYHGDVNGDGAISKSDALYVLYYSLLGDLYPENYPLTQDFDFSADEKVSKADALYLLYASFGDEAQGTEDYPLDGLRHDYYEPVWTWSAVMNDEGQTTGYTANLLVRCGCNSTRTNLVLGEDDGVAVTSEVTPATCVATGKTDYTAKVTYDGKEYTSSYSVVIPISGDGHQMSGTQSCESKSECDLCDYELPALGHKWVLNTEKTTPATCTAQEVQWYDCENCGGTKTVTVDGTLSHTYQYVDGGDQLVEGTTCTYVKTYKCSACGDVINGTAASDTYTKHSYKVTLSKEANCQTVGQKTYTCTVEGCGNSYNEDVPANGVHVWNDGVTENGVTTYTCTVDGCGQTKTSVAVTNDTSVSKEQLANELKTESGANVSLDQQTVDGLKLDENQDDIKEIKISITEADLSNTGLSDEQKNQVGDNTVYDFSMAYTDGTPITNFDGYVTVSLPYTLGEGEDIDSIDIWYIDDNGVPAQMKGTYSNGYVTFQTNHFSYYTVTRLTPAQRCARYGHIEVSAEKAATCTEEGYSMKVCQRCGEELAKEVYAVKGHDLQDGSDAKAATCTDAGVLHQTCTRCDYVVKAEIPALGHSTKKNEETSKAATCAAPGEQHYYCDREGCDHAWVEEEAQLNHDFGENEKKTQPADCFQGGYDHQKCVLCEQDIISNETAPLGHKFGISEWSWNEDKTVVTAKLVCKNNEAHTKEIKAAVSQKMEAASCTGNGYMIYTATVYYNGSTFTESVTIDIPAVGHQTGGAWESNSNKHYRICSVCGEKADLADHNWSEINVTKQPNCNTAGTAEYSCIVCGYAVTETIPATGVHNLVDEVCTDCGFTTVTCNHLKVTRQPVDLSGYDICGDLILILEQCECGKMSSVIMENSSCNWEYSFTEAFAEDGSVYYREKGVCSECGLTQECARYTEVTDTGCVGYYVYENKFTLNGNVLADGHAKETNYPMLHPIHVTGETINLADYGLCGGTATKVSCDCGAAYYYRMNFACNLREETCATCGGSIAYDHGYEEDVCVDYYTTNVTILKNGEAVLTLKEKYAETSHNYQVTEFKMDGADCEDGVTVHFQCADCGTKRSDYYTGHVTVKETVIDLTGYGSCATAVTYRECCCGESKYGFEGVFGNPANHEWTHVSGNADEGNVVQKCETCGYTRTQTTTFGEKDGNCMVERHSVYTLTHENGHSYTYEEKYTSQMHNRETKAILLGTTCEDGVELRSVCSDCGDYYIQNTVNYHVSIKQESYDLTQYGMCRGTLNVGACVCGQQGWHNLSNWDYSNMCNWEYVDGDYYTSIYRCADCGVTRTEKMQILAPVDDCHNKVKVIITFSKDDQELLEADYVTLQSVHRNVHTFEMLDAANGCEGGYKVTATCLDCGEVSDYGTRYWHDPCAVNREIVSQNQLCGDLELVTYSCPCGQESWVNYEWENGSCDFHWNYHEGYYVCVECGAIRTENIKWTDIEGESCKQKGSWNVKIVRNGKDICDYTYDVFRTNHKTKTNFTLKGATCDDGYTYNVTCSECSAVLYEESEVQYGCEHYELEFITIAQHKDICTDAGVRVYGCACGKNKEAYINWECNFEHIGWDSISQRSKYQCRDCGLIWYNGENRTHIADTCTAQVNFNETFELNGEVLGNYQDSFVVADHRTVATFEMFGQTCADGYRVIRTCIDCKQVRDDWTNENDTYHEQHQIGYYDLSEYGMCGGEYWIYGCACGYQDQHYGWNTGCEWEHKGYDEATKTTTYFCSDCKTFRYVTENGQRDPANCTYTGTETVKFARNDVELFSFTVNRNHESHEMLATDATLINPDGNCENGVNATMKCIDCDYTETQTYFHHSDMLIKRIDLSDGCGGTLNFYRCACGESAHFSQEMKCQDMIHEDWHDYDTNNIQHNYSKRTCEDCGLVIQNEWYNPTSTDPCKSRQINIYTVTYKGETYTFENDHTWESHDTIYTAGTLFNGATSCEDGVQLNWLCVDCGATGTSTSHDHSMIRKEAIDLAEYGADCGANLYHFACACGKYQRYDVGVADQVNGCDVHRKSTSHWISGVINDTQDTSAGWIGTYSNAYILKCAVTDPVACGLSIRMAEYWLNENCMAVEYQTWQLGYNEADGTFQKEITIATGDKHAYHPYETSDINETPATDTRVNGTRLDCPDCGSYAYHKYTYVNDLQTKSENLYVNTMYETNGENRQRTNWNEYDLVANGHRYESCAYWEEVHADGTVEWSKDEYTNYDFSNNDCKRTIVHTDSDGYTQTSISDAHVVTCRYFNDPEPTCSQHGTRYHVHDCFVCGKQESEDIWEVNPTGHNWNWDDTKQIYYCTVCALESQNGITGSITLEELTKDEDSVYTVGYWNEGNIEFTPKVSVILDEVTTDEKEFVLSGITFDYLNVKEDGVRALTFNKADTQAAAAQLISDRGYTGSYAIRISFVPVNSTDTLDYAITFDSQNTAQ